MKRNILVLSHTGGTGGGERVLLDAISTLASCEKYNIYVAYPVDADSGFKKALIERIIDELPEPVHKKK